MLLNESQLTLGGNVSKKTLFETISSQRTNFVLCGSILSVNGASIDLKCLECGSLIALER